MPALPLGSETLNMSKVLVALIVGALLGSTINAGLKPGAYIRATAGAGSGANADEAKTAATIAEKTAGALKLTGYFNLYLDAKAGKLWLEIDKWGADFLYQSSLPAGIGLARTILGSTAGSWGLRGSCVLSAAGRVLLIQSNLDYCAASNDAEERRAARDFAVLRH
jgi:hypothetical protein